MATKKPSVTTPEHYEDLEELPELTTTTYTVTPGDTWASIAASNPTPGYTKHQRATHLLDLNGGNLNAGRTINL